MQYTIFNNNYSPPYARSIKRMLHNKQIITQSKLNTRVVFRIRFRGQWKRILAVAIPKAKIET